MDILLYFGGPTLIAFLIQILIGCRAQHKILRYIPIYCFVIAVVFAVIALTANSGFLIGGNVIAALVWCIIGICFLLGPVHINQMCGFPSKFSPYARQKFAGVLTVRQKFLTRQTAKFAGKTRVWAYVNRP